MTQITTILTLRDLTERNKLRDKPRNKIHFNSPASSIKFENDPLRYQAIENGPRRWQKSQQFSHSETWQREFKLGDEPRNKIHFNFPTSSIKCKNDPIRFKLNQAIIENGVRRWHKSQQFSHSRDLTERIKLKRRTNKQNSLQLSGLVQLNSSG